MPAADIVDKMFVYLQLRC